MQMFSPIKKKGCVIFNHTPFFYLITHHTRFWFLSPTGSGNAGAITVNGVHIFIPPVIPGTSPVADVILAQAHSDIVCATQ